MKENQSNGYMLLFRGTDWQKNLSPEEMQNVMSQWMNWFEGLSAQGKVAGGDPLEREARVISKKSGQIVVDGVFPEANEAVAGYFKLTVDSFDEAEAIAKQCPGLEYGIAVEVRAIAAHCGSADAARAENDLATASA